MGGKRHSRCSGTPLVRHLWARVSFWLASPSASVSLSPQLKLGWWLLGCRGLRSQDTLWGAEMESHIQAPLRQASFIIFFI